MYRCPKCTHALTSQRGRQGLYWQCDTCHGRAVTVSVLRNEVVTSAVNEIWQAVRTGYDARGRKCPACDAAMTEVCSTAGTAPMGVDVCPHCMLIWFDGDEFEQLPPNPAVAKQEPELPQDAREVLALAKVQSLAETRQREDNVNALEICCRLLYDLFFYW